MTCNQQVGTWLFMPISSVIFLRSVYLTEAFTRKLGILSKETGTTTSNSKFQLRQALSLICFMSYVRLSAWKVQQRRQAQEKFGRELMILVVYFCFLGLSRHRLALVRGNNWL